MDFVDEWKCSHGIPLIVLRILLDTNEYSWGSEPLSWIDCDVRSPRLRYKSLSREIIRWTILMKLTLRCPANVAGCSKIGLCVNTSHSSPRLRQMLNAAERSKSSEKPQQCDDELLGWIRQLLLHVVLGHGSSIQPCGWWHQRVSCQMLRIGRRRYISSFITMNHHSSSLLTYCQNIFCLDI